MIVLDFMAPNKHQVTNNHNGVSPATTALAIHMIYICITQHTVKPLVQVAPNPKV